MAEEVVEVHHTESRTIPDPIPAVEAAPADVVHHVADPTPAIAAGFAGIHTRLDRLIELQSATAERIVADVRDAVEPVADVPAAAADDIVEAPAAAIEPPPVEPEPEKRRRRHRR